MEARGATDRPDLEMSMLVLTRKNGETISIGDSILIKVISVGNNRVKIGIDAPRSISVRRAELLPRAAIVAEIEGAVEFEPGDQTDIMPVNPPQAFEDSAGVSSGARQIEPVDD